MTSTQAKALSARFMMMTGREALTPAMDLQAKREMQEGLHLETAEPERVSYAEVEAGGLPALWCLPEDGAEDRALLYLHGGGFTTNSMHSHRKLAAHLAKAVGVRALVLDYRLAPEHPFPAQLEDAVAAFNWLLAQGVPAEYIATAGDSAGGNLATTLALKLRADGSSLPGAIVAFSPWYDMEVSGGTMETNAAVDVLVQRPGLEQLVEIVLADRHSRTDPLVNPLCADLTGMPPMFLTAGDQETLLDDAVRLGKRAAAAGVEVTVEIAAGMQHVYQLMAGRAPEATKGIADAAAWLRPKLGLS